MQSPIILNSFKSFLLKALPALLLIFSLSGCQNTNSQSANSNQNSTTKITPNNYYSTERTINSLVMAVKNYDTLTIQVASETLFQNLQKTQNYSKIIILSDENYPENGLNILKDQAKQSFPNIDLQTFKLDKNTNRDQLNAQIENLKLDGSLLLVTSKYSLSEDNADLLEFQKDFLKNTFDNFDSNSPKKLPYSNTEGLKLLADFNQKQKNSKILPMLQDSEKGFIISYFTQGDGFIGKTIFMTFMGDVMLDRAVRTLMDKNTLDYPFQKIDPAFLKANDLLIANLEGPIAEKKVKTSKEIAFRFQPDIAILLKKYHFDAVSLANNHALDMGKDGLSDSYRLLQEQGIMPFGQPQNVLPEKILKTEINGQKIALIGINNVDFKVKLEEVVVQIKALSKENYHVIIFPHWGIEYQHEPSDHQKDLAHAFIDAGALAVIGAHPHVVQSYENYKSKPIFYSLGNAIFDQYFSADTQEGLTLNIELNENSMKVLLMPIKLNKSQISLMNQDQKEEFLKRFSEYGDNEQEEKDNLLKGNLTFNFN